MVDWPIILRTERVSENSAEDFKAGRSAYSSGEARRYLRRAVLDSVRLLRNGEVLAVFPEAYPNIDPAFTPKNDKNAFLPFRPGFARLVEMAERDGHTHVAIVPAGLTYVQNEHTMSSKSDKRRYAHRREDIVWHVTLRFGPALSLRDYTDSAQLIQAIEEQVTALSSSVRCLPRDERRGATVEKTS
jgi:putative membrane protein